jgi:hypothetical protein
MDAKANERLGEAAQEEAPQDGGGSVPFLARDVLSLGRAVPEICPRLAGRDEDVLLAVGDLHVENFGVWRDSWSDWSGESTTSTKPASFPLQTISSAGHERLAGGRGRGLKVPANRVCALLLNGYRAGLRAEGKPILLSDGSRKALIELTKDTQEEPKQFWKEKLNPDDNPEVGAGRLPKGLEEMFRASFRPGAELTFREQRSPGGLGSLGRRRFTAVATTKKGVQTAREAKALVPSALYWCAGRNHMASQTATLLQHAFRFPDPHFQVHDKWLVRELAPDIAKIEMPENERDKRLALAPDLLCLMGHETANVHLGSRTREALEGY